MMFLWRFSRQKSRKSNCSAECNSNRGEKLGPNYPLSFKDQILGNLCFFILRNLPKLGQIGGYVCNYSCVLDLNQDTTVCAGKDETLLAPSIL